MTESARLLLGLALAGACVTFLGSLILWVRDPVRTMQRALRRVLGVAPDSLLLSPAHSRGVAIAVEAGKIGVCWDDGKWCLVYRLDELTGIELRLDDQVVGRVVRGEASRMLDRANGAAESVVLRLIFDDARYPDFDIELWARGDSLRRVAPTPAEAITEGNSWLARTEAILRRPRTTAPQVAEPRVATPPPQAPDDYDDDEDDYEDGREPFYDNVPPAPLPLPTPVKAPPKATVKKAPDDDDPELPF